MLQFERNAQTSRTTSQGRDGNGGAGRSRTTIEEVEESTEPSEKKTKTVKQFAATPTSSAQKMSLQFHQLFDRHKIKINITEKKRQIMNGGD